MSVKRNRQTSGEYLVPQGRREWLHRSLWLRQQGLESEWKKHRFSGTETKGKLGAIEAGENGRMLGWESSEDPSLFSHTSDRLSNAHTLKRLRHPN